MTNETSNGNIHRAKFVLFLIFQIPSLILSILFFIYFFKHRNIMFIRQNQGLLILMIINFLQVSIDMSMVIHFNRLGYVSPATPIYCTWWTFLEYTFFVGGEMVMSVISIQRHIFVFKTNLFNNRLYLYLFHHFPLLFFVVYPVVLYLIIIIFDSCDGTQWDYQSNVCGLANCYLIYNTVLATCDWAINNGLPIVVISLANISLIFRVVAQKRRTIGHVSWRKQRRMTIQLLSISCIYFIGWFPNLIIGVIQQLYLPTFLMDIQLDYVFNLVYFICLLLPWIYLGLFPQFKQWLHKMMLSNRVWAIENTVEPTNTRRR